MNPKDLLEQFLGPDAGRNLGVAAQSTKSTLASSGIAGVAGGVAAGGILGLLVGSKKTRKAVGKLAGGAVAVGGAAALGALAYRAYQNWQSAPGAEVSHVSQAEPPQLPAASKFLPAAAPASDGRPFELALVMAMIAAANADGHIDPDEQRQIFERVAEMPLDDADKGFVFDTLGKPPGLNAIAALAGGPEQAAELYLASRLAIDPDHPAEQAYLQALASRMKLSPDLVRHLEQQIATATG
ncbi:MAG: tellurite resistance TerB family protein [Pseudomonadota bacterium]